MAYGSSPTSALAQAFASGAFDPNSPNYVGMSLPTPAVSPQFQEPQLVPGEGRTQAIGPQELRTRGPMLMNAIPGQPNITTPDYSYSGGMGAGFENAPSPTVQQNMPAAPAPAMTPAPSMTPPDSNSYQPRQYTELPGGDYPSTTGGAAPAAPSQANAGSGLQAFFKALGQGAAWIAPPANAQAALGFRNADTQESQNAISNDRAAQELELRKQLQTAQLRTAMAPKVEREQSANGKFETIYRTNPLTGQMSIERRAIPADEQKSDAGAMSGKDPSAMLSRDITANNSLVARNVETLTETDKTLDDLSSGTVNFGAVSQGLGAVRNVFNMSDPNALKIAQAQRILQNLVEDRLNMEKGGSTNEKMKQVMSQVIPQGSAYYDNKQWEQAIRLQRKLLADRTATMLEGNAQAMRSNARLSQDRDPATGLTTHEMMATRAAAIRADQHAKDELWKRGEAGGAAAPSAPRITSPLPGLYEGQFGPPGAR